MMRGAGTSVRAGLPGRHQRRAEMPAELRATVTSVRYEDGCNAADRVEIGLANPDLFWLRKHIRGMGFAPFPTERARTARG